MGGKEMVETQRFVSRALQDPVNLLYVCALEQRNTQSEINDETNKARQIMRAFLFETTVCGERKGNTPHSDSRLVPVDVLVNVHLFRIYSGRHCKRPFIQDL